MQYTNCVNGHWLWFWPVGFFVFVAIVFTLSRFWWWGGRGRNYRNWSGHERHDDAMATLKSRYAKGEIDKDEFDKIRKDLGE